MLDLKLLEIPRSIKRFFMLMSDFIMIPVAAYLALGVRTDFSGQFMSESTHLLVGLTGITSILVFLLMRLYSSAVRFLGHEALTELVKGVAASTVILVVYIFLMDVRLPRSFPILYGMMLFCLAGGVRFAARRLVLYLLRKKKKNVAIYGAGNSGMELLMSLRSGDKYEPALLIDDDPSLSSVVFQGLRVYGPSHIEKLIKKKNIEQVLLAMPSAPVWRRKQILKGLEMLHVRVKTVPSLEQLVTGQAEIAQVRDVDVEDLLGRESVKPDADLLSANVTGKTVMVTGAGGSIGSELCRQIITSKPKRLLLFDQCEFALYEIERELQETVRSRSLGVEIVALLGCVQDQDRLSSVLSAFKVSTIYHAAAYKHVPIVEQNVIEGVKNNVFGTLSLALAARKHNVDTFVLISTDKAVRPTSVMGATKRMAELVLQGLATEPCGTLYSIVRFGNVLGSSGSVVPLFRKQIKEGGPLTVTHPDIIRYFMTTREAAQLVIQAGAMSKGGDVFVLDMGEPVKIADLARTMVRLMGMDVREGGSEGDIEICYTGLRPGEKLFEELLIGENAHRTDHPRIMKAHEIALAWDELKTLLDELQWACKKKNCETVRELLLNSKTGYMPTEKVNDLIWQRSKVAAGKVVSLQVKRPKEGVV